MVDGGGVMVVGRVPVNLAGTKHGASDDWTHF